MSDKIEKLKNMPKEEIAQLLSSGKYTPQQCQKLLKVWYCVRRDKKNNDVDSTMALRGVDNDNNRV